MATIDELQVKISAEISELRRRVNEAKGQLASLGDEGRVAGSKLGEAGDTGKAGLDKIQKSTTSARISVSDLGIAAGAGLAGAIALGVRAIGEFIAITEDARVSAEEWGKAISAALDLPAARKFKFNREIITAEIEKIDKAFAGLAGGFDGLGEIMQEAAKAAGSSGAWGAAIRFLGENMGGLSRGTIDYLAQMAALKAELESTVRQVDTANRVAELFARAGLEEVTEALGRGAIKASNYGRIIGVLATRFEDLKRRTSRELFAFGGVPSAQDIGLGLGPTGPLVDEDRLRTAERTARTFRAIRDDVDRTKSIIAATLNSSIDRLAQLSTAWGGMAQEAVTAGDIIKGVLRQLIHDLTAALIKATLLKAVFTALGYAIGGPAGAAASASAVQNVGGGTRGGSFSIGGSDAGQSAFTPLVASISVDMRDLVIGIERQRVEQRRLGVKIG